MLMGTGGVEGNGTVQRNMAHATAPGQCAHCHMPNSKHTYTVSYDVSCQPCHTGQGAADNANSVKTQMINGEYALLTRLQAWTASVFPGKPNNWWDYTSNIYTTTPPPGFDESQVPLAVRRARYNYYMILIDDSFGPHNFPYATTLLQVANDNLDSIGVPPSAAPSRAEGDLTTAQKLQVLKAQRAQAMKNMGFDN